jgi:hypothetical protein
MVPTQCPIKTRDNRLVEHIQPLQQPVCDSLPQTKQHNLSNKVHSSPRVIFITCFSLFPGNSTQWRPLLPKGGGLIQVDIGGHSSIPTCSFFQFLVQHVLLYLFIMVGSTLLGLSKSLHIFQVDTSGLSPNPIGLFCMFSCYHILLYFQGCFGRINSVFLALQSQIIDGVIVLWCNVYFSEIPFQRDITRLKRRFVCKSYDPGKLRYQLTHRGPHEFGVSPSRVRFLDV